jgi:hypothetical protein
MNRREGKIHASSQSPWLTKNSAEGGETRVERVVEGLYLRNDVLTGIQIKSRFRSARITQKNVMAHVKGFLLGDVRVDRPWFSVVWPCRDRSVGVDLCEIWHGI